MFSDIYLMTLIVGLSVIGFVAILATGKCFNK
jgi:hypothetical protein